MMIFELLFHSLRFQSHKLEWGGRVVLFARILFDIFVAKKGLKASK